jgi:branched-chain amino acid transport system substrate-binding protein
MSVMKTVIAGLMALAMLSCGGRENIRIGLVVPLTGDVKTFGESVRNGALLAFEEANIVGGINGRRIRVIISDDENDPVETARAGRKLIDADRVVAILGSVSSQCSEPLSDMCQEASIPMITPTSTNPNVTVGKGGKRKDFVFRACFIDRFQGTVAARFARDSLKAQTAAVLFDPGNDYSQGLADFFRVAFEEQGGRVLAFLACPVDVPGCDTVLDRVKQKNPDVLFIPYYYNKAGVVAKRARELGITAQLLSGDGWDSPRMLKIAGEAIHGGYFTNHYSSDDPRPVVQEWVHKDQAKYGRQPDALATLGYDGALLLVEALKKVPRPEPAAIRDALALTRDFQGVTGRIAFDEWGNPIKSVVVLQYGPDGAHYVATVAP